MSSTPQLMYLIRHGATEANLRQPYVLQGCRSDLALSGTGRQQAEAAAQALRGRAMAAIFASPLRRALETAQAIAQYQTATVQVASQLTECDVGEWEGLSWEEIERRDAHYFKAFQSDPATTPYAGGESFQQVQDRVLPFIEQIAAEHGDDLALVTHNVVGRVIVAHALGLPTAKARTIHLDNGGISILAFRNNSLKLITLNSVFHLHGLI